RRDDFELAVAGAALGGGVPMLAICRGIQVLNVARGGTLQQHLPDLDGTGSHRPEDGELQVFHRVVIEPGSRLEKLAGGAAALQDCPSVHHQAVGAIGEGLVVTARSDDGVVEGLETPPGEGWCVGIQWHPERTAREDRAQQALFDGFVAACG
ncbi:MAG: gamma-glutamyl-gamma-aminobutyrate hydrolase family protein, partial [Acidimicrobiaceae bacterium]|nr:gamma-glutamyl-gamma-aminobutyrate hydrolase family protein [Acidimicrobiaceae bacterium]